MKFIISGDFNMDFLNRPSQHLLDMLTLYQLKQLINIRTRTTETTSSCLDFIITQSSQIKKKLEKVDALPAICNDHNVPCAFLQNNISQNVSFKRTIYNYNKLNSEKNVIYSPVLITGRTLLQEEQLMSELISLRKNLQISPNNACLLKQ